MVSVIVGVALTLPISSAAICAALGLTGLAGGAAVAGCCAQMIGFAVMSYPGEPVWAAWSAQGLGTSMLQMGNIVQQPPGLDRRPRWPRPSRGPLATCLFRLEMNGAAVSCGMGTCGLVGQIGVYTGWVNDVAAGAQGCYHPHGLGCHGPHLLCSARSPERSLLRDRAQAGLDQRGRSEAEPNSLRHRLRDATSLNEEG